MDASADSIYGDIVLRFKKFLVEEGENEISVSQKSIYAFADTAGEVSILYLILNLMLVMVHDEPWMLI